MRTIIRVGEKFVAVGSKGKLLSKPATVKEIAAVQLAESELQSAFEKAEKEQAEYFASNDFKLKAQFLKDDQSRQKQDFDTRFSEFKKSKSS